VDALQSAGFLGTVCLMEPTPFELTPEQKDFLEALSRQTGKSVSTLIAEALERLQED
jgi:predicted DNA-binding protein